MGRLLIEPVDLYALAMQRQNIPSGNSLGRRCGVAGQTAAQWLDGRSVPTDSRGLTLATLADIPPELVLIGLAHARTDCPESRALWRRISLLVAEGLARESDPSKI